MNTDDVSLFMTVLRLESISKAAEQLFMSQSTVTTRLQRLERTLGYTLFHRLPSGVRLTENGVRFLPLAQQLVGLVDQMHRPDAKNVPVLRIMSGRAFVSTDVPSCLARMARQTGVHFEVRMGLYDEMKDALLAEQVDFCFLGEPIYHPNIARMELAGDAIDLIVPLRHHFLHDFPGLAAIAAEPLIAFSQPSAPFRKRVTELLAKEGVYPTACMEIDSIDGIKAMVSHGLGVAFLPRRTLADAGSKQYAIIPLHNAAWVRPTLIAYPESLRDKPLTDTFLRIVSEHFEVTACEDPSPHNL